MDNDAVGWFCKKTMFFVLLLAFACGNPIDILGVGPSDTYDVAGLIPPDGFSGPGPLTITGVTPDKGPVEGGTRIHITGTGFVTGTIVLLGQVKGIQPVVENSHSISVTTPPHNPGTVDIRLVTPDYHMVTMRDAFTYWAKIEIKKVTPDVLPTAGGVPITIQGKGFTTGCLLFVGGRRSPKYMAMSPEQLTAIVPDNAPGPASVVVSCPSGEGHKRNAVRYVAPATIRGCTPLKVTGTGTKDACVLVQGQGFDDVTTASIDGEGVRMDRQDPGMLRLCFDVDKLAPGSHTVTLVGPGGRVSMQSCFVSVAGSTPQKTSIVAVIPNHGSVGSHQRASVIFSGPGKYHASPSISFGSQSAMVLRWDPTQQSALVKVPVSQQAGPVDVSARLPDGECRLAGGYTYDSVPVVTSITPVSGPVEGNTNVTLSGTGLGHVDEVRFGPLPGVLKLVGATKVVVSTPRGAPGPVDIRVHTSDGHELSLAKAFAFFKPGRALSAVYPASGATCGGAHIHVYGAGFTRDTRFFFGSNRAMPAGEGAITPSMASLVLPPNDVGPVDVTVKWPDHKTLTRRNGFVYFDPTSYYGGTWGEPIEQVVNVVVKENRHGKRIPNAFVMLGDKPWAGLQGYTNSDGMLTIWNEGLRGPVAITAAKQGYSASSLVGVDAENITLFLTPHTIESGGGGNTGKPVPHGIITGRVTGISKGILAPPGDCATATLDKGIQCVPCQPAKGCANPDFTCADALGTGWYCIKKCASNSDCPDGYACYGIKYQLSACLPAHGTPVIRCYPAPSSGRWGISDPGPGFLVQSNGAFGVSTRPGDIAVYCVGGFMKDGHFQPLAMGVARHVAVQPGQLVAGVEVPLNIPLDRTLNLRVLDLPDATGQPMLDTADYYLHLGSDGAIAFWPEITGLKQGEFRLTNLPDRLSGPLSDATLSLYFEADYNKGSWDTCAAYTSLDSFPEGPALYHATGDTLSPVDGSWALDIQAACPDGQGKVLLFSGRGLLFVYDPASMTIESAPFPYGPHVLSCVTPTGGSPLAAARDGVIWSMRNQDWHQVPTGISADIESIATGGMGTFAVGGNVLIDYNHGNPRVLRVQKPVHFNTVTVSDDYVLTAGQGGSVYLYDGASLYPVRPAPVSLDMVTSCTCGNLSFLAGAKGTVVQYDGQAFSSFSSGLHGVITAMTCGDNGAVWVATDRGDVALVSLSGPPKAGHVLHLVTHGFKPTAIPLTNPLTITGTPMAFLGPIVWIPTFEVPQPYSPWSGSLLQWQWQQGPLPDFARFRFNSDKGVPMWDALIRGDILQWRLPDLKSAMGYDPLKGANPVQLSILGVISTAFNINAFDQASVYSTNWVSWSQKTLNLYRKP